MTLAHQEVTANAAGSLNLHVAETTACPGLIGRFAFADGPVDAMQRASDLAWLGGDIDAECWHDGDGSCSVSGDRHNAAAAGPNLCMLSRCLPASRGEDIADATRSAYLDLLHSARASGYPWLLRAWHFVPGINVGAGDDERYRQFCLGRDRALSEWSVRAGELGAATAVGTQGGHLRIHFLMGRYPGSALENPRQVPAYSYPREYGPRPPAFSRAMTLPLASGGHAVLVSGTASIVGHETMHPGCTEAQVEETIANLEALLGEAARRHERPRLAHMDNNSFLRVYLRRPGDWAVVEPRLRRVWPSARLTGLAADICRRDLMVEVEAFHCG